MIGEKVAQVARMPKNRASGFCHFFNLFVFIPFTTFLHFCVHTSLATISTFMVCYFHNSLESQAQASLSYHLYARISHLNKVLTALREEWDSNSGRQLSKRTLFYYPHELAHSALENKIY